ncbi:ROK family protein [Geomesophilobacter sediminis]|uniref:ROK family protein n=1 Tax=Geomesophilobacter sediminis TaxID=2798584 RepID=A0A8J7M180_9BACT|nr:ROK family protein [Geomesophilobacter sediminis]MBJ6726767.1 ROK family protein [Geomesophilobacter sediminis]
MKEVCLGVDVGGTNLRCAMVTAEGEIIQKDRIPTDISLGREAFVDRLLSVLFDLKREADRLGYLIGAVGLGIPGLIANDGCIHSSVNLLPLEGFNLAHAIGSGLGIPVVAGNDANACAVGEKNFGAGRPYQTLLALTLGTGVGSGLILDGKLWTGIDGVAGEFGHVTVEPAGIPCGCGNRGCLEQYASASAIAAAAAREFGKGEGSFTADAVAQRAHGGDVAAAAIFGRAGSYLGIAIAGAVNLLNLEAVIIGGGVAQSFDLLADSLRLELTSRAFAIPGHRVRVLKGELGDDAGVLGASVLAFEALKKTPHP